MSDTVRFFKTFVRHPTRIGAVVPSGRSLARRMVEHTGLESAGTVIELGPGTGVCTRVIEERLAPEALFLALELDPGFASDLEGRVSRARVIHDSAEEIGQHLAAHGREQADAVISALPWASFPPDLQERCMSAVLDGLRPGGRFTTIAYIHAAWFPTARRFHRYLKDHFSDVERSSVVWRNVPPAFVYRCTR